MAGGKPERLVSDLLREIGVEERNLKMERKKTKVEKKRRSQVRFDAISWYSSLRPLLLTKRTSLVLARRWRFSALLLASCQASQLPMLHLRGRRWCREQWDEQVNKRERSGPSALNGALQRVFLLLCKSILLCELCLCDLSGIRGHRLGRFSPGNAGSHLMSTCRPVWVRRSRLNDGDFFPWSFPFHSFSAPLDSLCSTP